MFFFTLNSDKKTKATENSKSSPPSSASCTSNGQHGPTKKKKLAEMLVDRVFRKTASSFKVLSATLYYILMIHSFLII